MAIDFKLINLYNPRPQCYSIGGFFFTFGSMLRTVLATVIGLMAAFLVIYGVEWLSSLRYPLPKDLDIANHQAMTAYIAHLPKGALINVLVGWALGSIVCGFLIRIISKSSSKTAAYLAGLLLMTTGIVNIFMYPHPIWFIVIGVLLFIPCTLLGHSMYKRQ